MNTLSNFGRLAGAGLLLCVALAATPTLALADSPTCVMFEVAASRGETAKMDPSLAPIENKLKRPPLSSWNVFTLLMKASEKFEVMQSKTIKFKRATANIVLREVQSAPKRRYSFSVAVDDEAGKRVVDTKYSFDAGDYVVIGRSVAGDAGHLLAIGGCQ